MGIRFDLRRVVGSAIAAAVCGGIAWTGNPAGLPLTFVFLLLYLVQRTRAPAYAIAFVYYAASTWPLIPGANTFFGPRSHIWEGLGLWLAASVLLAVPWGLLFFVSWPARQYSLAAAITATTLPPIGLFGWASPLTAAGILFPGFGWLGIFAMLLLPPLIVRRARPGIAATVALVATAYCLQPKPPVTPSAWVAVNTTSGRLPDDPVREFENATLIQELALRSAAHVVVFPETAVPRWNQATELFWEPTLKKLAARGQTVVLGTTIAERGTLSRLNGVLIRGADDPAFFVQRIPVPFSMWQPFQHSDFPLRLSGPGMLKVAGERAGILICYEMLVNWPVLSIGFEHPTILIGVANDYWARDTPIPAVQQMCISAWARLFSVPALVARNT
jgi:hypothetical protein